MLEIKIAQYEYPLSAIPSVTRGTPRHTPAIIACPPPLLMPPRCNGDRRARAAANLPRQDVVQCFKWPGATIRALLWCLFSWPARETRRREFLLDNAQGHMTLLT